MLKYNDFSASFEVCSYHYTQVFFNVILRRCILFFSAAGVVEHLVSKIKKNKEMKMVRIESEQIRISLAAH